MNNSIHFSDFRLYYYRYKDSPWFALIIVGIIFFVSIIILARIALPQIQNWLSIQSEVEATTARIAVLQTNQNTLTSTIDSVLAKQFSTASSALPYEKDFVGILEAINTATVNSGVVLNDFSFQVGDLSTQSAQLSQQTSISIKLSLVGELEKIEDFMKEIYENVPLAEIIRTSYSKGGSSVSLVFFYKIAPQQLQIQYTQPFKTLSGNHQALLKTIEEWKSSRRTIQSVGSESGEIVPF